MADICCYIHFSKKLNKFYTGACQDSLQDRIAKHNDHYYGDHRFTSTAADWGLFLKIDAVDSSHAIRLERKIKSMKSSTFIKNLAIYPELITKLINETS